MWKPWNNKDNYQIPEKPQNINQQVSMMWDYLFNHLPSRLKQQDRRLRWQDVKINFILLFVALILASLGKLLFS